MISSTTVSCQCQPVAQVEILGAQITRFDFLFNQNIPIFSLSDIEISLKSKNTENQWFKLELYELQHTNSQSFSVWIKPDIHSKRTKLLSFNSIKFTQEELVIEIKIQFSPNTELRHLSCQILPIRCIGVEDFQYHNFNDFSYSLYSPQNSTQKHPLIVCLHGAGEGGFNQSNILADKMAITFWNQPNQELFNYPYILAPQCPSFWLKNFVINGRTYYGKRDYTEDLSILVTQIIDLHPDIDRNRIYIVGSSMGGYQGLRLWATQPNLFAAALIACPAKVPTQAQLGSLKNKPILLLHSNMDHIVPVDTTKKIIHALASHPNSPAQSIYCNEIVIENQRLDPHCVFLDLYENKININKISIFEWLVQQKGVHYDK